MPKLKHLRTKKAPDGFDQIEPILNDFEKKMREIENMPHEGKRKTESLWPIFQLNHQRSKYIYNLYYKHKLINRQLYIYLLDNKYCDKNLIAKWKKQGYENLCCLSCIQPKDNNFNTTCVCRVPRAKIQGEKNIQCIHCGCKGCASGD